MAIKQEVSMPRDFAKVYNRKNTNCYKWDKNEEIYGKGDVISMWVADMDLPTAEVIEDSIIERAIHPLYGYTFRDDQYYEGFIAWQRKRNNWLIDRHWLIDSTSVVTSINMIIRTLTKPGDQILIFTPVYSQFHAVITETDRKIITSPLLNEDSYFKMDYADFENKLAAGIKLLIFCSPHNPVGRVWQREELEKLVSICQKYGTIIISDEIHSDLIYPPYNHVPLASISKKASDITITCMSPGKTFNVSGLCNSLIIIENKALRDSVCNTFSSHHLQAANIFGIQAFMAAYQAAEPWLKDVLSYLRSNRDHFASFIREKLPLIKTNIPEGTYLAWLDFRELGLSQNELQCFLVFAAGLGLDNGTKYGSEGAGFMRLNFACSREVLQEALSRLHEAIYKLIKADFVLSDIIENYKELKDCD
jgi:cysteine-S-conjugate beta-lyase